MCKPKKCPCLLRWQFYFFILNIVINNLNMSTKSTKKAQLQCLSSIFFMFHLYKPLLILQKWSYLVKKFLPSRCKLETQFWLLYNFQPHIANTWTFWRILLASKSIQHHITYIPQQLDKFYDNSVFALWHYFW